MSLNPQKIGVVHFVGIGGIGMSGLAEILCSLGFDVQGSDLSDNSNVQRLKDKGIPVFIGQKAANIEGAQVVVISSAVRGDNPEILAARANHIPVLRRVEMLSEIMRLKPAIAVAGTHGKTTTTSLGATVLRSAGLDPTIISGGIINALGTNAILGQGEWTIVEADESDGTFEKLPAQIAIVTNIDPEHLDYYGSYETLKNAFQNYLQNIPFFGLAILCADHPETLKIAQSITDRRVLTYGFSEHADLKASVDRVTAGQQKFSIHFSDHAIKILQNKALKSEKLSGLELPMAGQHNLQNALAVITAALELELTPAQIKLGLKGFKGVNRRFTVLGKRDGVTIVDDYAHHPTEIAATILAAKEVADQRVICVIQPHRYSRLKALFDDYVHVLRELEQVIILPVYAAGETEDKTCDHFKLVESLSKLGCNARVVESDEALVSDLETCTNQGDLVVFMGAGDVTKLAKRYASVPQKSSNVTPIVTHHKEARKQGVL